MKFLKKQQKEQGRSMVEMLGVLAIIGVLSIGGIAGYTMAMNRYKANQVLDMASKLSVVVQTAKSSSGSSDDWNSWTIGLSQIASEYGGDYAYAETQNKAVVLVNAYETTALYVYKNGRVVAPFDDRGPVANAIQSITGRDNYVLVEGDD